MLLGHPNDMFAFGSRVHRMNCNIMYIGSTRNVKNRAMTVVDHRCGTCIGPSSIVVVDAVVGWLVI